MISKLFLVVLALVSASFFCSNAQATTVSLYATQDAEIANSNNSYGAALNDTNFGASPYLTINGGTIYGPAQTRVGTYPTTTDSYGLVQFTLASIPEGSVIESAILTLYALNTPDAAAPTMLYPVTSSWTEMGVTYNTKPTQGAVGIARLATSTYQANTYDVTDIAQDWLDGTVVNYGMITSDVHRGTSTSRTYTRLFSRESVQGGEFATDPRLDITYTAPVPEPASMVLLGMGLFGMAVRRFRKEIV